MAEYDQNAPVVESTDRGLFGFGGKKEEEEVKSENAFSSEFKEKVQVSETEPKHESLLEKLHRSDSSSSSSSDEEEFEEGGEIKKKKKLKLKEKIKGEDKKKKEDTSIPVEKCDEVPLPEHEVQPEEKKGFMGKIKDKLPGGHKKAEEVTPPPAVVAPPPAAAVADPATPTEEKKGFLEKIKEKLPGYHSKTEEEKEKKETDHN